MRKLLVISDYDLISGDTCQVGFNGYKSALAAYCAKRRQVRKFNKADGEIKMDLLDVVFYQDGLYYAITKNIYSQKVLDYLRRADELRVEKTFSR